MREEEFADDSCAAALDGTPDARQLIRRPRPAVRRDALDPAIAPALRALPLAPPRVLITLTQESATFRAIRRDGRFGLSLLGDGHKALAQYGAATGAPKHLEPAQLAADALMRSPVVRGAVCHVDCEIDRVHDADDHLIVVGRVTAVVPPRRGSSTLPLLYFDGAFHHLGSPL
jgi:flavin reductase (DIM6/NTAB) family NADH-FMN oxidoreductase RutF